MNKEEAIKIARDIISRVIKDKFDIKDELAVIFALKENDADVLVYLKDIKKLIEELINVIEK